MWDADSHDHAETPLCAYQHIHPLVAQISSHLGIQLDELRVYDPFFCAGASVRNMKTLGWNAAMNPKEDFWRAVKEKRTPSFDVLVTNPPFSGDHIPRLLDFVAQCSQPSFLLIPDWVAKKPFFHEWSKRTRIAAAGAGGEKRLCFVGPTSQPYQFAAPAWARDDPSVSSSSSSSVAANTSSPSPQLLSTIGETKAKASSSGTSSGGGGIAVSPSYFTCVWFIILPLDLATAVSSELRPRPPRVSLTEHSWTIAQGDAVFASISDISLLPNLTPVPRLTPAERRWRKKQRKLGGGVAGGEELKGRTLLPSDGSTSSSAAGGGGARSGREGQPKRLLSSDSRQTARSIKRQRFR